MKTEIIKQMTKKELVERVKKLQGALFDFLQLQGPDANPEYDKAKMRLLGQCPEFIAFLKHAEQLLADPKCPLCQGTGHTTAHKSLCSCVRLNEK